MKHIELGIRMILVKHYILYSIYHSGEREIEHDIFELYSKPARFLGFRVQSVKQNPFTKTPLSIRSSVHLSPGCIL